MPGGGAWAPLELTDALMNASMISLESYVLVFLSVGWPAFRGLFCCNLCLTVTFALLFAFILRRVSRKQALVILLIQPRKSALLQEHHERNSFQKLCAIINSESEVYRWTIQAVWWYLTSERSYLFKCGRLFRKGERAFYARIPVEAQW